MRSSYREEDVILLLKDITGMVEPQSTKERERLIQAGRHYCEMLPIEYVPSEKYMEAYREALQLCKACGFGGGKTGGKNHCRKREKCCSGLSCQGGNTDWDFIKTLYCKKMER